MNDPTHDWLKVVYRPTLEPEATGPDESTPGRDVVVRLTPPELDLGRARGRGQRVRVTVVPPSPGQRWRLFLDDETPGADRAAGGRRVWWRADPGSWQPLASSRSLVGEGRGRTSLDLAVRVDGEKGPRLQLRFIAETADAAAGSAG